MNKLEFIDTHIHFWNLQHPDLRYEHLQPGFKHPVIKEYQKLREFNYEAEDYLEETRKQLDEWGVKYNDVAVFKPLYDVWIDDKAFWSEDFFRSTGEPNE